MNQNNNFLCALYILAFLQSGKSNTEVSISHSPYKEGRNVTCVLSGKENMTQVNWEMRRGLNHTKLGTFHPTFGTHIPPEYKAEVEIQGKSSQHSISSLVFKVAVNESVLICCAFVTFPSGKLEQCTDISKKDDSINTSIKAFTHMKREPGMGIFGHFGAMIIGSILSLSTLTILFFICRKSNCRRRQSFDISVQLTEPPAETQEEESPPIPPSSSHGFDPSKLYAKIKKDLFYGRLWKSYQGQPKAWTQDCTTDQGHVYHLLGQSPSPKRNAEAGSLGPDEAK